MRFLIAALALVALPSCGVKQSDALRVLSAQGLKEVSVEGYAIFGCGEDDVYRSSFSAKDQQGKPVSGVICGGVFKGYTVRFD